MNFSATSRKRRSFRACPLINHVCERGRLGRVREALCRALGGSPRQAERQSNRPNLPVPEGFDPNAPSTLSAGWGVGPTTPFAVLRVSNRIGVKRITRFINGQALRSLPMSTVSLKSIAKTYCANEVIRGIDLDVESGEFVVFVEPSGCRSASRFIGVSSRSRGH